MTLLDAATLTFLALLAPVVWIDLRTRRIPDPLNAAIALTGLGFAFALDADLVSRGLGVISGYGALWAVNAWFRQRRGHDGVGMGDAKFLAAAGAWVGWMGLPFILVLASASALVMVAGQRLTGRQIEPGHVIAFGPYLAGGAALVWLIQAYLG